MITEKNLNAISNDFKSTFSLIDENTITNLLLEDEKSVVEFFIKKYIKDVRVEFVRTFKMSKKPNEKDVWIIKIQPAH